MPLKPSGSGPSYAQPGSRLAAATPVDAPQQVALRYPATVVKMIEQGLMRERIFLFEKPWPAPICPAK